MVFTGNGTVPDVTAMELRTGLENDDDRDRPARRTEIGRAAASGESRQREWKVRGKSCSKAATAASPSATVRTGSVRVPEARSKESIMAHPFRKRPVAMGLVLLSVILAFACVPEGRWRAEVDRSTALESRLGIFAHRKAELASGPRYSAAAAVPKGNRYHRIGHGSS